SIEGLPICWRQRWCNRREVVGEVIPTPLIVSAELWPELACFGADDTRRAWICVRSNHEGVLIKGRSRRVGRRVRQRRIHTRLRQAARAEKHAREQAAAANATREIPTALIKSAEGDKESVCRNVAVRAEEATSALPEIGDNNNVCL